MRDVLLRPYRPKGSDNSNNPSLVLGVFGLSVETNESHLREQFGQFGQIEKITLIYDKSTGQS